jgi:hypothetical protein
MISSPVSALRRTARITRLVARASRAYRANPLVILQRALDVHFRLGYAMEEVAPSGALNPKVPRSRFDEMACRRQIRPLQVRLNPCEAWPLTENKAVFYRVCEAAGLPIPVMYAVISRGGGGWTNDGDSPCGDEEWADALLRLLPGEFVSKPVEGHFGVDVRLLRRVGATVHEEGTETTGDLRDLRSKLLTEARFDALLLQQRIHNHQAVAQLSGTKTLQTVRVLTLLSGGESVELLTAYSKIVGGDAPIDNIRDGSTGNGTAGLDLESGRLSAAKLPRKDGLGLVEVAEHPRTGLTIAGFQIPFWKETIQLVQQAAPAFAPSRALAWDVAVTPEGPVLIEANALWGPMNERLAMGPLLRRLREALATSDAPRKHLPGGADSSTL